MTEPTNPVSPPAGWHIDDNDQSRQRWWDGVSWTEHYRPAPNLPIAPSVARLEASNRQGPTRTRNRFALVSVIIGVPALLLSGMGIGAGLGVIALTLAIIAFVQPGNPERYRTISIVGMVLGSLSIIIYLAATVSVIAQPKVEFDDYLFKAQVMKEALDNGIVLDGLICPESPVMEAGNEFQCIANNRLGDNFEVNVWVQDDAGTVTWDYQVE